MSYYSEISLYIKPKESVLYDAMAVLEKYGYPHEAMDIEGNEIRYKEGMVKFLGYSESEDMLKELRDLVEDGEVECYGEEHEFTVYEFRDGRLFRVDYEYKEVGEEEIT